MRLSLAALLAPALLAAPAAAQVVLPCVEETMPELMGGLASIQPDYPASERRADVEGRVFLQFVVGEDGSVSDIRVVRGVSPALDAAAVEAVRRARFHPGTQRGRPVPVRFSLPVTFRLTDPVRPPPPDGPRDARAPSDTTVGLRLSAPVPNPIRGRARVVLTLDRTRTVTVALYDLQGRRVATLLDGPLAAGTHAATIDAALLAAGPYVVRAVSPDAVATRRAVVVR